LDADPQDIGITGAVDLKNVRVDRDGTVRSRGGSSSQSATAASGTPKALFYFRSPGTTSEYVYAITATNLAMWYHSGTLPYTYDSTAAETDFTGSAIFAGDYLIFGTDSDDEIKRVQEGLTVAVADLSFTAPTGRFVALAGFEERIAVGYSRATTGAQVASRVIFSGPIGTSTSSATWGSSDYVDLGTSSPITGMATWRDMLFVFKADTFFVFYGSSTDATGGAIFNYREVNTGLGAKEYAVCAADDGVYFVNDRGVYRTMGGEPQLMSRDVQPYFDGETNGYFTPVGPMTSPRVTAGPDYLYVSDFGTTTVLALDLLTRQWTYWQLPTAAHGFTATSHPRELLYLNSSGTLYRVSDDYTTDNGAGLAAHYQSGYGTLADGRRVRTRGARLEGSGTVTHAMGVDLAAVGTGQSVSLSSGIGWDRRAVLGRHVSFKASATSGAWSVSRWTGEAASVEGER
jgi:hypothetical protein